MLAAPHPDQWILDLRARIPEPIIGWISESAPAGGLPASLPSLLGQPDRPRAASGAPAAKHLKLHICTDSAYILYIHIHVCKPYSHIFLAATVLFVMLH